MNVKEINIAVCTPLTGRAAVLGKEMEQAVQIAVAEQDMEGNIRVQLLIYDDESSVAKASRIAEQIASDNTVFGVVGNYGSDTTLASAKIFARFDLPMIIPVASNPMITESGLHNVFRYTNQIGRAHV